MVVIAVVLHHNFLYRIFLTRRQLQKTPNVDELEDMETIFKKSTAEAPLPSFYYLLI